MNVMWRVLNSLTVNKPNNNTYIITVNGRACVCQRQKANTMMIMYKPVSTLSLTKEDWSVKRIHSRTLGTLRVTNGTWPGFLTSEIRAAISNLNSSKAAGPIKIHQRLIRLKGPVAVSVLRQIFRKSRESTSIQHGWWAADVRPDPRAARTCKSWSATVQSPYNQQSGRR